MGEQVEECLDDLDMTNTEITFDNLVILRELENIVNLVKNEDFLETVPKSKFRRVKWIPMFNYLKQAIHDEMVQELSSMWEYENMPEKLAILEKQKEKFSEINEPLWRPQLGNVKAQLKANDVVNLKKQKLLLESITKEYEARVNRLKNVLTAKRGYIKALQMDIQKFQKKNEEYIFKINEKFENHVNLTKTLLPNRINIEEMNWSVKDLDTNEN